QQNGDGHRVFAVPVPSFVICSVQVVFGSMLGALTAALNPRAQLAQLLVDFLEVFEKRLPALLGFAEPLETRSLLRQEPAQLDKCILGRPGNHRFQSCRKLRVAFVSLDGLRAWISLRGLRRLCSRAVLEESLTGQRTAPEFQLLLACRQVVSIRR